MRNFNVPEAGPEPVHKSVHLAAYLVGYSTQSRFQLAISFKPWTRRFSQDMELTHLMGHIRPELFDRAQFALLRIGNGPQHFHP
ncbi:hypothetical protein KSF_000350 [Reticulibacter mediterranei]|uniref:Uncharacterized protein n=1 Tax=Reticulibacter mediterranei TaxID=2778369 RepID=A0A8J3N090_9CHLR|nr:hypothetical protein KSF_000350 [Reticulibacter mediterranei]